MSPNFTLLDQLYTQERLLNSGYTRTTMRRKLRTKELISVLQGVYIAASHSPLPAAGSAEAAAISRTLMGGGVPAQYRDSAQTRQFARL